MAIREVVGNEAASLISGILAPSVMISGCGLLLLGLQNKYSSMIDRIRALNEERRRLLEQTELPEEKQLRLESVREQVTCLLQRSKMDRNAVLCLYAAIISFVLASIFIGTNRILDWSTLGVSIVIFMVGTALVLAGAFFAFQEVRSAYRTVLLEVESVPEEMESRHASAVLRT